MGLKKGITVPQRIEHGVDWLSELKNKLTIKKNNQNHDKSNETRNF